MLGVGMMELVVLGLLLGPASGAMPSDLVSLLNAEAYFQNHNIPIQADKLIELASQPPTDAKGRIGQLLAIRWLDENAAKLGAQKQAAQASLRKLSEGPQGFARDHALRALARLEGRPAPVLNPAPRDSVRQALEWFPEDMSFVAVMELRGTPGQKSLPEDAPLMKDMKSLLARFQDFVGGRARGEIYRFAEAVGNLRIDRYAVGFDADEARRGKRRIIMRLSGAGDGKAILTFFQQTIGGGVLKEEKGPKGEPILLLTQARPPAFAVIDNTDLIVTGYDANDGDHEALLREILDIRAGKKANALKGMLAKHLQAARPEARGLLVGVLPAELRRELSNSPLSVAPQQVMLDLSHQITATGFALSLGFHGVMEKEADSKALLDGFNTLKLMAVKGLDDLGKPKDTLALKKVVQAAALKADGTTVKGQATLSSEAIQAGLKLLMEMVPKEIRP